MIQILNGKSCIRCQTVRFLNELIGQILTTLHQSLELIRLLIQFHLIQWCNLAFHIWQRTDNAVQMHSRTTGLHNSRCGSTRHFENAEYLSNHTHMIKVSISWFIHLCRNLTSQYYGKFFLESGIDKFQCTSTTNSYRHYHMREHDHVAQRHHWKLLIKLHIQHIIPFRFRCYFCYHRYLITICIHEKILAIVLGFLTHIFSSLKKRFFKRTAKLIIPYLIRKKLQRNKEF